MIGFKVGKSRPVFNRTVNVRESESLDMVYDATLGKTLRKCLEKSDFISIRRVND